jgi:hypothetical protein
LPSRVPVLRLCLSDPSFYQGQKPLQVARSGFLDGACWYSASTHCSNIVKTTRTSIEPDLSAASQICYIWHQYVVEIMQGQKAEALRSFQNSERISTQHRHDFIHPIPSHCSVISSVHSLSTYLRILGQQLSLCYKLWPVLTN